MTFEEMEALLGRFTYKPGWRFQLDRAAVGTPYLSVSFETEDTRDAGRVITVGFHEPLLPQRVYDPEHFKYWLRDVIHRAERHEADEWLRLDGEMIFDPHERAR